MINMNFMTSQLLLKNPRGNWPDQNTLEELCKCIRTFNGLSLDFVFGIWLMHDLLVLQAVAS